jgi:pimeloyl-ACP methyl ester carboxylesterase
VVALTAVLAGCGGAQPSDSPPTTPAASSAAAVRYAYPGCLPEPEGTAFAAGAVQGAVFGTGTRAVVFSNMAGRDGCDWVPVGRELAAQGFLVAVWSYGRAIGVDQVKELASVVQEVRRRGAAKVVLVGGSRGGCLSMLGATQIQPPVTGLAILSCAGVFNRDDPVKTAPYAVNVRVPVLHLTAEQDYVPTLDEARADLALFPTTDKKLLTLPGAAHGAALLKEPAAKQELLAFLTRVTS